MKLSHTSRATSAVFDDPNLVSAGGLVPVLALAESAGLRDLADQHLTVPGDKGANAGLKVASLVGGMVAGADSIDDMALLRHGGMGRVFARAYAPSTLGSFLRAFTFGHVRQLDAIASRFLIALAGLTELLRPSAEVSPDADASADYALLDVDDTIIEVHGHAKQGAGFGYSGVRGLNALLATLTIAGAVPVIVAQRLRKGSTGSPRGAKRLVGDAVRTARRLLDKSHPVLVRMDSAFYGRGPVHAALKGGAAVSVTVRMDKRVKAAIATIDDDAWTTIEYTDAVFDEASGRWVSRAEVAEIGFTAFAAQKKTDHVPGRLVVRRIPDFNAEKNKAAGQDTLFDTWRFHAFFTTTDADVLDTVAADAIHRHHAVIEQVHADLKHAALAHLPSGVFTANAAWLVLAVMAFNLTRAAASLTDPQIAKATTATIRRKLITVPARVATSARRVTLHLPQAWPWETAWTALFDRVSDPPPALAA
ncbi:MULTISPECIES: IS1380 family transposase [Nocardioides]|uniref:IS1380 family transposase n=1 Tax=Nocardioides TaxID=1839 RepID=UPI001A8C22BB|nr:MULTISPECIES: IS1380 family transposase [Nocardioides]QSR32282.1 IS1380 family transposase [Nocardioides sp. S5]QSR32327.1 IS1380 family transposase [Nocardioides sp. S5]